MSDFVFCKNCNSKILSGIPFCPHCGNKQTQVKVGSEFDKTPHEILQVSTNAETEVIEAAYKSLSKKYHPDTNRTPEAEEKMKEINWAYDILSKPGKKTKYYKKRETQTRETKYPREESIKTPKESTQTKTDSRQQPKPKKSTAQPAQKETISSQEEKQASNITDIHKKGVLNTRVIIYPIIVLVVALLILVIRNNQINYQSKIPTSQSKHLPKISTTREEMDMDEAVFLWDIPHREETYGNIDYYYFEDLNVNVVAWGTTFCSDSFSKLNENWDSIKITYQINDFFPDINYFQLFDYNKDQNIEGVGVRTVFCRWNLVNLWDWVYGNYVLQATYYFTKDIDSGWGGVVSAIPANTTRKEIYIIKKK